MCRPPLNCSRFTGGHSASSYFSTSSPVGDRHRPGRFCGCSFAPLNFEPIRPGKVEAGLRGQGNSMLNLKRVFKNYDETGSLNAMVNLFGFIGPEVFLTKSGEAGLVLELQGVDYECLDTPTLERTYQAPGVGTAAF